MECNNDKESVYERALSQRNSSQYCSLPIGSIENVSNAVQELVKDALVKHRCFRVQLLFEGGNLPNFDAAFNGMKSLFSEELIIERLISDNPQSTSFVKKRSFGLGKIERPYLGLSESCDTEIYTC